MISPERGMIQWQREASLLLAVPRAGHLEVSRSSMGAQRAGPLPLLPHILQGGEWQTEKSLLCSSLTGALSLPEVKRV